MSEYILNGDFSSNFDNWDNGISFGLPYTIDNAMARGISDDLSADIKTYKMKQDFTKIDEAISGNIDVWAKWECPTGVVDGTANFIVELRKPDFSFVSLLDTTKTGETGEGYLLQDYNILSHLSIQGNYELWLELQVKAATISIEPDVYSQSSGWYDNISIDIAVKKYKTIHERMGSEGALNRTASVTKAEVVGILESISTQTWTPTINQETASEVVGFIESYSALMKRTRIEAEVAGLTEVLQAVRTQGNIVTTYNITDLTAWSDVAQVSTPWIKEKTEIIN